MKHSQILRKAKKRIWNGRGEAPDGYDYDKDQFICNAVHSVVDQHEDVDYRIGQEITNYITKCLGGSSTVEMWLIDNKYIESKDAWGYELKPAMHVKVQKYRKAWMDHLIKHYEEQGL